MKKHELLYPEVEFPYIIHKIKGQYKFETVEEVKAVLYYDIREVKGFKTLSEEKKALLIRCLIMFINRWGLEYRATDKCEPFLITDEPKQNRFKVVFKEKNYSYLLYDGGVR
jgi:hypothetical protein